MITNTSFIDFFFLTCLTGGGTSCASPPLLEEWRDPPGPTRSSCFSSENVGSFGLAGLACSGSHLISYDDSVRRHLTPQRTNGDSTYGAESIMLGSSRRIEATSISFSVKVSTDDRVAISERERERERERESQRDGESSARV
jgi:hypothetical protein